MSTHGCLSLRSTPSRRASYAHCVANGHVYTITTGPVAVAGEDWFGVWSTSTGTGWSPAADLLAGPDLAGVPSGAAHLVVILLGLTLGIGLEVKYTIAALIAGIGLAVLLTPALRAELRAIYPWLGTVLLPAIWAPNAIRQGANDFPSLRYALNRHGNVQSGGPVAFVVDFLVLILLLTPLWIAGFIALFRNRDLRPIGIACAVPLVVFLFVGKYYYPAPTIPLVVPAGLLALPLSRVEGFAPL